MLFAHMGGGYQIKWVSSTRPQPTIGKDHAQKPTRWLCDGKEHCPTTEQLKIIGSYPQAFMFVGNANDAWNRIGNSVPPMFMRAIAARIAEVMFGKASKAVSGVDYPAILEAAWQQHLAPRQPDAPTVISAFAGCGGSSLGYSMAGFRELLAVEWDNNAVETFKLNFPGVPVYHGDICKLSVDECMELAGVQVGELDVLDGSPPCQGFSTAGKRQIDDPRNQLFREYVRLLQGLRPKVFVMENVSGMVKGKMKLVFADILRELKASGYQVSARLLNAMYFHVPQSRERMIFIGVREDLGVEPSHPKAESRPVTVREVWDGINQSSADTEPAELKSSWQMSRVLNGNEPHRHFGLIRIGYDKPSQTIQKDAGNTTTGMIHPTNNRRLTIPEIKRLSSFSDGYRMSGKYREQWARIGNSVPPLFMRAIARHIRQQVLTGKTPERQIG